MAMSSAQTQPLSPEAVDAGFESWKLMHDLERDGAVATRSSGLLRTGGLAARGVGQGGAGMLDMLVRGAQLTSPMGLSQIAMNLGRGQGMQALASPASPAIQSGAQSVMAGLPQPEGFWENALVSGVAGATGGALAGPAGLIPGAVGGMAAQGANALIPENLPPMIREALVTAVGVLTGGATAKGQSMIQQHRSPSAQAAQAISTPMQKAGDQPVERLTQAAAVARANPTLTGREVLGREGQAAAEGLAAKGGPAGRTVVERTGDLADNIAHEFSLRKQQLAEADIPAQQALMDQAATRTRQLKMDADRQFRARLQQDVRSPQGGVGYERSLEQIYQPRIERAYALVDRANVRVTPELAQLLDDPVIQRAWEGSRTAMNPRVQGTAPNRTPVEPIPPLTEAVANDPNPLGLTRSLDPTPTGSSVRVREVLPWRGFDAMKKRLQAAQFDKTLSDGDRSEATAALSRITAIIEDHVDVQVPAGRLARRFAEDYARHRDALALGRNLAAPAQSRSTTRGQISRTEVDSPEEASLVYNEQNAQQRAATRAGLTTDLARLAAKPNAAKAIGDPSRFAPWLTPAEIAAIRNAQEGAARTIGGRSDATMIQIRQRQAGDRVGNALQVDPETQRIGERAAGVDRVLAAGERNPQNPHNTARRLLGDVLLGLKRMAVLDMAKLADDPHLVPKSAEGQANLAGAVTASGQDLTAILAEYIRQQQSKQHAVPRGAVAGAAGATAAQPR